MNNVVIPEVLKKPLVVGNNEQIKALRYYKVALEKSEKLKMYNIDLSISGFTSVEVEAYDEDEARRIALEEIDLMDYDCRSRIDSVSEVEL